MTENAKMVRLLLGQDGPQTRAELVSSRYEQLSQEAVATAVAELLAAGEVVEHPGGLIELRQAAA